MRNYTNLSTLDVKCKEIAIRIAFFFKSVFYNLFCFNKIVHCTGHTQLLHFNYGNSCWDVRNKSETKSETRVLRKKTLSTEQFVLVQNELTCQLVDWMSGLHF